MTIANDERDDRGRADALFLERLAASRRSCSRAAAIVATSSTAAIAWPELNPGALLPITFAARNAVEAVDLLGPGDALHRDQRLQRDHVAVVGPHVDVAEVLRLRPVRALGLQLDAVRVPELVEVVDVQHAHRALQRVEDVPDRHAERQRLLAVDVDEELRRRRPDRTSRRRSAPAACADRRRTAGAPGRASADRRRRDPADRPRSRRPCPARESAAGLNASTVRLRNRWRPR